MGKEERNTYTIKCDANLGEVKIADEVVAVIAGYATMEVDGVASMAGSASRDIMNKIAMRNLSRGVKVDARCGKRPMSRGCQTEWRHSRNWTNTGKNK